MKRAIAGLAMIFSVSVGPASADDALSFETFTLTPNIGTLGPGIEGGWRMNEYWGARAGINGFATKFTYHDKDSDFVNKLMLLNAGVTADYYPFQGNFRLSGGVRASANKITGKVLNLKKQSKHFSVIIADPLTDYTMRQNAIQPYIGAGYQLEIKERVSLNLDFGMLYAGAPDLSVHSRAGEFGFTPRQINREIEKARNRLAPFQVYPVVQLGFNIKF